MYKEIPVRTKNASTLLFAHTKCLVQWYEKCLYQALHATCVSSDARHCDHSVQFLHKCRVRDDPLGENQLYLQHAYYQTADCVLSLYLYLSRSVALRKLFETAGSREGSTPATE